MYYLMIEVNSWSDELTSRHIKNPLNADAIDGFNFFVVLLNRCHFPPF